MSDALQMLPKPAEIDQAWPFGCYLRSAGALVRLRATVNKIRLFPRPLVSSETLRRAPAREGVRPAPRKAETCVCVSPFSLLTCRRASQFFACRRRSRDHVYLVDGCRYGKSAPADGWNGKRPCFCGLRRFAKAFGFNQRLLSVPDAKRRKPQKRRKAEG